MTEGDSNSAVGQGGGPLTPAGDRPEAGSDKFATRRKLLVGGLVVAPAMLTLTNRPAFANHCTVSGMASGNLSNRHEGPCEALRIEFWRTNPTQWPAFVAGPCNPLGRRLFGMCEDYSEPDQTALEDGVKSNKITAHEAHMCRTSRRGTRCSEVFGTGIVDPRDLTMMQALWLGRGGPSPVIAHAVAAVLNAHYFGKEAFGYSPDEIVEMICGRIRSDSSMDLLADLERLNNRA